MQNGNKIDRRLFVIIVLSTILLSACGSDLPSEADARQVYYNKFKQYYVVDDFIKEFTKTNAWRECDDGDCYVITYEITTISSTFGTVDDTGRSIFRLTENGWLGEDGNIY